MPRKKKKTVERQEPKETSYTAKLTLLNGVFNGTGITILEALQNLGLDWPQVKTKGVIVLTEESQAGTRSVEHLYYPRELRMLVNGKFAKIKWSRLLELALRGKSIMPLREV